MSGYWTFSLVFLFSHLSLSLKLVDGSATLRSRVKSSEVYYQQARITYQRRENFSLQFLVSQDNVIYEYGGLFEATFKLRNQRIELNFNNSARPVLVRFPNWTKRITILYNAVILIFRGAWLVRKQSLFHNETVHMVAGASERFICMRNESEHYYLSKYFRICMGLKINCDPHFFGPDCAKFCRPQNGPSGHYSCDSIGAKRCRPNWSRKASNCTVPTDPCRSNRCRNKAVCVVTPEGSDFYCQCPPDYRGRLCEIAKGPCERAEPCRNGGQCLNVSGQAKCWCPSEFRGPLCETFCGPCPTCAASVCIAVVVTAVVSVVGLFFWMIAKGRVICFRRLLFSARSNN